MGVHYNHLTREKRIIIATLLQEGKSKRYIAQKVGFSPQAIYNELKRNSGLRGYRHKQAQGKADARKQRPNKAKMTPEVVRYVEERIREKLSPEQISGSMLKDINVHLSHEKIYQHIWDDKRNGGDLYKHLRIAGGKRRRKRYGKKDWRGRIPGRVDIEERPKIVDLKKRIGDWEADLVCGKNHKGFLVTLVERKSKYTLIGHVEKKSKEAVGKKIIELLKGFCVHTITYDNGREFADHEKINRALKCNSYFARPYHSWERGLNENTNGLIRQYFPKSRDLHEVSVSEIYFVEEMLNSRPRKTLAFKTPEQVLLEAV